MSNNRFKLLTAIIVAMQFAATFCVRGEDLPISSELKGICIYHPEPNWWGLARRGMHGRVVCRLTIDPKTGEVTEVKVLRKTVFEAYNAAIVLTAFKWRFRPGTITQTTVPFELITRGFFREIH
jgi:TonB family protein